MAAVNVFFDLYLEKRSGLERRKLRVGIIQSEIDLNESKSQNHAAQRPDLVRIVYLISDYRPHTLHDDHSPPVDEWSIALRQ